MRVVWEFHAVQYLPVLLMAAPNNDAGTMFTLEPFQGSTATTSPVKLKWRFVANLSLPFARIVAVGSLILQVVIFVTNPSKCNGPQTSLCTSANATSIFERAPVIASNSQCP